MAEPVQAAFSASVLRQRRLRGWSREALSARSGVSGSTIANVENGHSGTTLGVAARLAGALGATISELAGDGRG